jgi:hypothetical protein
MEDTLRANRRSGRAIRAPIFVLELPRTGTTILPGLLASDRASRVPMSWEVMTPWPPPEHATFERSAHRETGRVLEASNRSSRASGDPSHGRLHRRNRRHGVRSSRRSLHHHASRAGLPGVAQVDRPPLYRSHRRWLQYFQWRAGRARVLKSPGHLWTLDALLAVYGRAHRATHHRSRRW